MPMERREKLVDIERKSNPHTKGEVLIKKRERRKLNTNSSQRTELWKKQPIYRKWGAYKKKEDERRIAHKGQNSVEKTEHKESNLEKDLFKAKLC